MNIESLRPYFKGAAFMVGAPVAYMCLNDILVAKQAAHAIPPAAVGIVTGLAALWALNAHRLPGYIAKITSALFRAPTPTGQ